MGIIGFFKDKINNTLLNININLYVRPFIEKSQKDLSMFSIIENPDSNVVSVINKVSDNDKYYNIISSYSNLLDKIATHNSKVNSIKKKIDSFDFELIINKINEIKKEDIINTYAEGFKELASFDKLDVEYAKLNSRYKRLIDNYDVILKQYQLKKEYEKFLNKKYNKYIDYKELKNIEKTINEWKRYCKINNYYNINFINPAEYATEKNKKFVLENRNTNILDNVNGYSLDLEQREAVVKDEVANLVIAGAGSGKTLTICGKVKYLIEKQGISKDDILLLSYSKKSADDLNKKISLMYEDINVSTFHALGLKILTYMNGTKYAIEEQYKAIIEKYFREDIYKRNGMLVKVIEYIALYSYPPTTNKKYKTKGELYDSLANNEFKTLKDLLESSELECGRLTLKKEMVKSYEELAIANFYFINGINYEYEHPFKINTASAEHRQYTPDFYLPDYDIYHEHYGVDRNGRCTQYSDEEEANYINGMAWKRAIHQGYNTNYIETYSYEFSDGDILDKLKINLMNRGVVFKRMSKNEIMKVIGSIYNDTSFKSFINLVVTFINLYKATYSSERYFDELKKKLSFDKYNNKRCSLLLDICKDIYCYYMDTIRGENKIDFDDMILKATNGLSGLEGFKYKYIIVDEFQDISNSRMRLVLKLLEHGGGKLFAVGDDYQAIYRFTGCDLNYFVGFNSFFPRISKSFITSTHRNSMELQNIVVPFITKNPLQLKKKIKSNKHLAFPIKVMYYDEGKSKALADILDLIYEENNDAHIMLLGRNNADIYRYRGNDIIIAEASSSIKYLKHPSLSLKFSTVHGSKGLEEEYVILINADDDIYGFPNKMEDDIILNLVLSKEAGIELSEERRLWYVALTRTKSYTYIIANRDKPSSFLLEILDDCEILNENPPEEVEASITCPGCKTGRLILRKDGNGRSFYGCSHYPYCKCTYEVRTVKENKRCPQCGNFLRVKKGRYGYFYSCCSYPICRYTESYTPKENNSNRYQG